MTSCSKRSYQEIHGARQGGENRAFQPSEDTLSLRQLRPIISAVYASKAEHDQRCLELEECRETMEQHLYNFLGRRYPVKKVVQQWAVSIYRAIQKHGKKEVDIMVFGKILQNRLSESFSVVQESLLGAAQKLLRSNFEAQLRMQSEKDVYPSDVDALWKKRLKSGLSLGLCRQVISRMYSEVDFEALWVRLQSFVEKKTERAKDKDIALEIAVEPDADLRYSDFLHIVLTFQMELTEGFLKHFLQFFQETDTDHDGILGNAQLQELLDRLCEFEDLEASVDSSLSPRLEEEGEGGEEKTAKSKAKKEAYEMLLASKEHAQAKIVHISRATFSECADLLTDVISARWDVCEAA